MNQDKNILVVGTGLIGTSIALGLTAQGLRVFLSDIDSVALDNAIKVSGATKYSDQEISVVFVATPPASVAKVISASVVDHPNAVITDVASVKGSIFRELEQLGTSGWERIVGGHPMAGREVSGAMGAQGNLFLDRPWVIASSDRTSADSIASVKQLVETLGAFPIFRTIEEHDRAVALISHTPQVVASVLAGELMDAEGSYIELAGQGIRDTIRIAGSDSNLWTEILSDNSQYISQQVTRVANHLLDFASALEEGNRESVTAKLVKGNKGRDRLPGKHGSSQQSTSVLVVRLDDKPGELARLFTVAAQANVNLEDVRIDHSLGQPTGLVELTVALEAIGLLKSALEGESFVVIS
ncbi:MAG: prephenate dehydrogenase [Candidatus Nanopelagicales bacterium]|nr:prephenate dehydrogenase [Candidatus Nanopelagicales bacterium]